ncbi:hypothetical protein GGF32_008391 [Allomyces javanicus]|nr:hypothetical protein GGF32_008391 [Allomyces javanicus]
MPTLLSTTTDKPSTAAAPGIPAALQRYLPASHTTRIACIAVVVLVLAAVVTAIVLVATVKTPLVVPDDFGRANLKDAPQGAAAHDATFVQFADLQLRVYNDNLYPVDFHGVHISITTTEKPVSGVAYVKATQVASDPWPPLGLEWPAVPGGGKRIDHVQSIKVDWPVMVNRSAVMLTRALKDCGVDARTLPKALVQQAEEAYYPDVNALTVSVTAREIVGVFGIRVATNTAWSNKLDATSLLCPGKKSQSMFENLVGMLNVHWNTTTTTTTTAV